MRKVDYINKAHKVVEEARTRVARYAGDCKDCKWSEFKYPDRICGHPVVQLVSFNQTDGYAKRRIVECEEQRDKFSHYGDVVCGPDGALFEEKEQIGFLERLFG